MYLHSRKWLGNHTHSFKIMSHDLCLQLFYWHSVTTMERALAERSHRSVASISTRVMDNECKDFQQQNIICKRHSQLGKTSQPQCQAHLPRERAMGMKTWISWINRFKWSRRCRGVADPNGHFGYTWTMWAWLAELSGVAEQTWIVSVGTSNTIGQVARQQALGCSKQWSVEHDTDQNWTRTNHIGHLADECGEPSIESWECWVDPTWVKGPLSEWTWHWAQHQLI